MIIFLIYWVRLKYIVRIYFTCFLSFFSVAIRKYKIKLMAFILFLLDNDDIERWQNKKSHTGKIKSQISQTKLRM